MATVSLCDRCQAVGGQVVPVLGVECCSVCITEIRAFLSMPPVRRSANPRSARVERIMRSATARGYVNAAELAGADAIPYRTAYYTLMALTRTSRLVHLGRGRFEIPKQEPAE